MADALIGLGGNVGHVRRTLDRAIEMLCDEAQTRLVARSSAYRTRPWGYVHQPPFINACIAVETTLSAYGLLAKAQSVERALGRERAGERRWGPRPIDIDLLAYDDVLLRSPQLQLPHPRLFTRAFVLVPLVEIVPERLIAGVRVRDAVSAVDTSGVERLSPAANGCSD
jgi:2-amino-4-hydroxy-6-hydroxymethyldihydropteridine diphosphokinase